MSGASPTAIGDLVEGAKSIVHFTITSRDMLAFAELSGDHNPLHVDELFARSKGYEGRVVYGALLLAKVSQLIGMQLPGRDGVWASVSLDFRKPLYLDEPAEVEGTVVELHPATGMLRLALVLRAGQRLLARGKAEVLLGS